MSKNERIAAHKLETLARMSREFYRRGWMWGTSGNLSVKIQDEPRYFAITASGVSKSELTEQDIVVVEVGSNDPLSVRPVVPTRSKPSAEASIHAAIYDGVPKAGAVFHVHTISSTLVSDAEKEGEALTYLRVPAYEMTKGWGMPHAAEARVPLFHNWPDVERIAGDVKRYLTDPPLVPVLIVRGHGVTVWGKDMEQAKNHLEIAEFIFQLMWQKSLASKR